MDIFKKDKNYMLINLYNYKKSIFSFSNKTIFDRQNIKIYSNDKYSLMFVYYNTNNFFNEYDQVVFFLNQENIYFEFIYIKYNFNYYSFNFFEKIFNNSNIYEIYEDIFVFCNLILFNDMCKKFIFTFTLFSIIIYINNLNKCLLFTKQLLN